MGAESAFACRKRQIYQMDFSARAGAKRFFQSRKTRRRRSSLRTEFLRHGLFDNRKAATKMRTRHRPPVCRMESRKRKERSRFQKVKSLSKLREAVKKIEIPNDWNALVKSDPQKAIEEQNRIKRRISNRFCRRFDLPKF